MKNNLKYAAIVTLLLILVSALILLNMRADSNDEVFMEISSDEIYTEAINNDISYIYFGRDSCIYCRVFEPMLAAAIRESNVSVYKYDTSSHENDDNFLDIRDQNEIVTVPKLVKWQNGQIVGYVDHKNNFEEIKGIFK